MPCDFDEWSTEKKEHEKLRNKLSVNYANAVAAIDGALELLSAGRYALALVLIDNAIELSLKAQLEAFRRLSPKFIPERLTSEQRRELVMRVAKLDTASVPAAVDDSENKGIKFKPLLDAISPFHPTLFSEWQDRLIALHRRRNDVQHDGPDVEWTGEMVALVLLTGLPFLEAFLQEAIEFSVAKNFACVYREIEVAQRTSRRWQQEQRPITAAVLRTFVHKVRRNISYQPQDEFGAPDHPWWDQYEQERDWLWKEQFKKRLPTKEGDWIELDCRICGEEGHVLPDFDAMDNGGIVLAAEFRCPECAFWLTKKVPYLLNEHLQITEEERARIKKAFGCD